MKNILCLTLLTFAMACSSASKYTPGFLGGGSKGGGDAGKDPPISGKPDSEEIKSGSTDTPLELVSGAGSSMRFMDAIALDSYYKNIFPKKEWGYDHCRNNNYPAEISDCTRSIFTASERVQMGAFDLYTLRQNRGKTNVNPVANLTLNYTRTLRAALSRECTLLVNDEFTRFKANNITTNILIKANAPTEATVQDFMSKLFGVAGKSVTFDVDNAAYVAAFKEATAGDTKDATLKNSYQALCIALSMDPTVFLY